MAHPESEQPGEREDLPDGSTVPKVEGGKISKHGSEGVICSAGARHPLIDRILGGNLEEASSDSIPPKEDGDTFISPFEILAITEPQVAIFTQQARKLGLPTKFLQDAVMKKTGPVEYLRSLQQWGETVIYQTKKLAGVAVNATPIASRDFHNKAKDAARFFKGKADRVEELEQLLESLQVFLDHSSPGEEG